MNFSFKKIVEYLLVKSKYDHDVFDRHASIFLRTLSIPIEVFTTIENNFRASPPFRIPKSLLKNNYREATFLKWVTTSDYANIHDMSTEDKFIDLIYDTDTRFKIDMLAMSGFQEKEIFESFGVIDQKIISVYLDCFCNFSYYNESDYIRHIGLFYEKDPIQTEYARTILENMGKKDFIRSMLMLEMKSINTSNQLEFMKNTCFFDFVEAVALHDDDKKEKFINLFAKIFSAGKDHISPPKTEDSLQDLLARSDDDLNEPKCYTMEDLNKMAEETTG